MTSSLKLVLKAEKTNPKNEDTSIGKESLLKLIVEFYLNL
ncbi:hypothetical protein SAMN06265350_10298 [Solitalea koreensis]|uniref:Uncharacterized protein n=1 Tax=Solitalea koreensis TaxID=543615 RepID=A0A521BCP5_9SPHI|nr:hypothetical protein SAMN06265350_10298 [Solitalea koreensis]